MNETVAPALRQRVRFEEDTAWKLCAALEEIADNLRGPLLENSVVDAGALAHLDAHLDRAARIVARALDAVEADRRAHTAPSLEVRVS